MSQTHSPTLVRALRRRDIVNILINTMVGSGMMAAPSKVFALAPGWSLPALAASALLIAPLILCFAELGSRFSAAGGPYLYARAALPGWLAFAVGWLLWISKCFAGAALTNLLLSYLGNFLPVLAEPPLRGCAIILLGATATLIALRGVKGSVGVGTALVALKLLFVVAFIAVGAAFIHPSRLTLPAAPPAAGAFAQALLVYIFAYTGFEQAGVLAGEARSPQRDLPWALLASLVIATALYAGVLVVCGGVLDNPAANERPLAEVGRHIFGPAGAAAVSVGAIVVVLGVLQVGTVAAPRMLLALAERGQLPRPLAAVHPRWRTPHVAILLTSAAAFGLAFAGDLLTTITFSTISRVLCYILCCAALWRLTGRPDAPAPQFRLPAARLFAGLSIALLVAVLLLGAMKELATMAAVLAVGLGLYGGYRASRLVRRRLPA